MNGIGDLLSLYVGNGLGVNSGSAQRAYQAAHQNALAQNQLLMQQAGMTNMPQPKPSNVMPIRRLSNGRNVCPVCAISHETTVAARSCCAGKQAKPKKKASRTNVTPIRPLRTRWPAYKGKVPADLARTIIDDIEARMSQCS